ncbi:hypothetical protein HYC85_003228 [Camellia sinensis]|uniref:Uncharacterized protein n=1 Tax=Camellia sinensis TaxID=4442 RepID=A0A7J7IAR1_CAMSI|nr:hypothetical protein HYC85_003228 [Camellia sinensis]
MATMPHSESRPLYSWWWDSHNSPKNSKWLQENLKGCVGKALRSSGPVYARAGISHFQLFRVPAKLLQATILTLPHVVFRTDMNAKVRAMIMLIEEDADSFARRAEM